MTDEVTVYHDGSCPLCRAEIAHYRRQAGAEHLAFVDVSRAGCDTGRSLTPAQAMARFHIRLPDGTLRSGAAGFATVWGVLPKWRWAGKVASLPGVASLLELGYRLSLPTRPILARLLLRGRQTTDGAASASREAR